MRIQLKLLLPTVCVAIVAAGMTLFVNSSLHRTDEKRRALDAQASEISEAALRAKNAWREASLIARVERFQNSDPSTMESFQLEFDVASQVISRLAQMNASLVASPDLRGALDELTIRLEAWGAAAQRLSQNGQLEPLIAQEKSLVAAFDRLSLAALDQAQIQRDAIASGFINRVRESASLLWAVSILAIGACLFLARTTIIPLTRLAAQAEDVATGRAKPEFDNSERRDEVGRLSLALSRMMASLDEKSSRIERMAYRDPDTGLPNRANLQAAIAERQAKGDPHQVLLVIAVNEWENVPSIYGSSIATKAAHAVSARLASALARVTPPEEGLHARMLARFAPNAYAVLLSADGPASCDTEALVEEFTEIFSRPFRVQERVIRLSPRFSISASDVAGQGGDALINTASLALDDAKSRGVRSPVVFTSSLREGIIARREIEEQLRGAIDRDEFELHFQPFVTSDPQAVWGAEALLRWRRPSDDGSEALTPPGVFIPVAEESGLICDLDDWVVREACMAASRWRELGMDLLISANVSPLRFEQEGFDTLVAHALRDAKLPARNLKLEITETAAMADPRQSGEILEPIKAFGVQLSIDDFGSGYSNLSTLASLPFDCLKIDRSLLPRCRDDRQKTQIMSAVAELARHLKLWMVVEGVETEWQRDFARSLGCQILQGFLFSKPLPEDEFIAFAAAYNRRNASLDALVGE